MGLLSKLFPALANPTRYWVEDLKVVLTLDLDAHRLNDVGLGDPFEGLAFLGPARCSGGGAFDFANRGVEVGAEAGRIRWFSVYFEPEPRWSVDGAFNGSVVHNRRPLDVSRLASEADVLRTFGPPYWRDQDEDEILLFYEFGPVEWGLELSLEGRLRALDVSEPILADSEQRKAYGVTKAWPPG